MDKSSMDFLLTLLNTPSPSGSEEDIQRKWLHYTKPFADEQRADGAGNAISIINPEGALKIMLAGHCDEIGFMVKEIDADGYIRVEKLGGISHKPALGMKVDILGDKEIVTGVFGVNAEHQGGTGDGFSFSDLFIDCGASNREEIAKLISIGDTAVYHRSPELLFGNKISGRGLDNRTGAFIAAETIKRLKQKTFPSSVAAVSTVNEETNMGGAYYAGAAFQPDLAIVIDVTFAYDYPGSNRGGQPEVKLGGGPVLALGPPVNKKAGHGLKKAAEKEGINIQYELTPRQTGTDADKIRYTGSGITTVNVSLPLRYMHSPVETASLEDIEDVITLLAAYIEDLGADTSFKPLILD